ncbi:MAG: hypothetical protein Tp1124DCM412911_18 [Prokaryotic dsDNA virus sp.]|nr:MAG: hypothetical protein Tp1124DCM412911_18 [Prokaryotic dsDNA virus sp.]|tara:strand:+ start:26436 stop:26786 length:351 start_codon:yes stop_codon:yes gene_type:complete
MALSTHTAKGLFVGTDEITLVPAYTGGLSVVTMLRVVNTDTASIVPILRVLDENKLGFDEEYLRLIPDITLETSEYMEYQGVVCVLTPGQSLVTELTSAVSANEPEWSAVWAREVY